MKTKNFRKKISIACGSDDLRPVMSHLFFDNGYVIATDAHLLLKQSLKEHAFTEEEISIMNGKLLHRAAFDEIFRYDHVTVSEAGFTCRKGPVKCIIEFSECENKFPDYEAVIPKTKLQPIDEIGLNMKIIHKISQLTLSYNKNVKFSFRAKNKAVIITPLDGDVEPGADLLLVMPVMIGL